MTTTPSTTCPTQEQLLELLEGNLANERFDKMLEHVVDCPTCHAALDQLEPAQNEFSRSLAKLTREDLARARREMADETTLDSLHLRRFLETNYGGRRSNSSLTLPRQLGPYRIEKLLGRGGMGEIYAGRHARLERPIALKVVRGDRQDDPALQAHFLREMTTAGKFDHPNLVRAYDAWEEDGCLYLVLELLEGASLQGLVDCGQMKSVDEILDAAIGIFRGLGHLHSSGILHRDIKPGNVMRLPDGSIKLIDFGLAILAEEAESAPIRREGTRGYSAPEQLQGHADFRSDIYSAGCVLQVLLAEADKELDSKGRLAAKALEELAAKMTNFAPEKRIQSATEALSKLDELHQQLHENQNSPKRRGSIILPVLLSGMVLFACSWLFWQNSRLGTLRVENARAGDVLLVTGRNGTIQPFKLRETTDLRLDPGDYRLELRGPSHRKLSKAEVSLTRGKESLVRIESLLSKSGKSFPLELVEIPAGSFEMGAADSDKLAKPDERPRRRVVFSQPFRMSACEITVGQFAEFVESTGYVTWPERSGVGGWKAGASTSWGVSDPSFNWANPGYEVTADMPVTLLEMEDIQAFCSWLSKRDGRTYRLPTEAEWEYACRAGEDEVFAFPISKRDDYAWSSWNSRPVMPHPVKQKRPNRWGLYDMIGNARELCLDWYDAAAYQRPYADFPTGPPQGALRVVRGGGFMDKELFLRNSVRLTATPGKPVNNTGFRLVLER